MKNTYEFHPCPQVDTTPARGFDSNESVHDVDDSRNASKLEPIFYIVDGLRETSNR